MSNFLQPTFPDEVWTIPSRAMDKPIAQIRPDGSFRLYQKSEDYFSLFNVGDVLPTLENNTEDKLPILENTIWLAKTNIQIPIGQEMDEFDHPLIQRYISKYNGLAHLAPTVWMLDELLEAHFISKSGVYAAFHHLSWASGTIGVNSIRQNTKIINGPFSYNFFSVYLQDPMIDGQIKSGEVIPSIPHNTISYKQFDFN